MRIKIFLSCVLIFACSCSFGNSSATGADTTLIRMHLKNITKTPAYRNYRNPDQLNRTADYIYKVFEQYADTVFYQEYNVEGTIYKNVVCRFGTRLNKAWVIVGAHYDVCGDQQGADDNASGVVGLLELARMLSQTGTNAPIELVAYTLEEPPFFRTPYMGSAVHALNLKQSKRPVRGMIALEMIAYFDDRQHTQDYPVKGMKMVYGTKGDFILLVKRMGYGPFVREFSSHFHKAEEHLSSRNLKAPSKIGGIDFSDHLNYWNQGFDALMVSNTAFFRNKNYHQKTDTLESLNIPRMAEVIQAVFYALVQIK